MHRVRNGMRPRHQIISFMLFELWVDTSSQEWYEAKHGKQFESAETCEDRTGQMKMKWPRRTQCACTWCHRVPSTLLGSAEPVPYSAENRKSSNVSTTVIRFTVGNVWFSCSSGLAKAILQGTVKGRRRKSRQRKRWEDNIREWTDLGFAKPQKAVENRGKWRKLVAKSSVVPQRPSWIRDWWWWWLFGWPAFNFSPAVCTWSACRLVDWWNRLKKLAK